MEDTTEEGITVVIMEVIMIIIMIVSIMSGIPDMSLLHLPIKLHYVILVLFVQIVQQKMQCRIDFVFNAAPSWKQLRPRVPNAGKKCRQMPHFARIVAIN
ncbi:hypothetical protein LSG31_09345 [Fodinisporobacter ferrooxydans]|uniref:Uncharacterized protein n=1 Tax=Fodinisporobacter ferrooxydans TaxID=2901836 RepID=A0ABY4CSX6_9BACL|nr:hypothetical protein LSG31_09345 [Alicyclobacillaceae bacterium MYW30-H2]